MKTNILTTVAAAFVAAAVFTTIAAPALAEYQRTPRGRMQSIKVKQFYKVSCLIHSWMGLDGRVVITNKSRKTIPAGGVVRWVATRAPATWIKFSGTYTLRAPLAPMAYRFLPGSPANAFMVCGATVFAWVTNVQ